MSRSGEAVTGPAWAPRSGDVWANKWRIGPLLGQGAMGTVHVAHHLKLNKAYAIKFLSPQAWGNADALGRFQREAQAAAAIASEHVVRVWDHGIERGLPYIVMERLDGRDLARWLGDRGPLPVEQATDFILQACDAIHEAHTLGIIHRDIKPANLFVVERGKVETIKVLDFGISKAPGLVAPTVKPTEWVPDTAGTEDRMMMGSAHYMSPEQMESARDVDERTDVWALGVTLYELAAGRLPFVGTSALQVYASIAAGATPLREHLPDVPPGFEEVVERCLCRRRDERYRTVAELAAALLPYGSTRAVSYVERFLPSEMRLAVAPSLERATSSPPEVAEKTMASASTVPEAAVRSVNKAPRQGSRGGAWRTAAILAVGVGSFGAWAASRPAVPPRAPRADIVPAPTAAHIASAPVARVAIPAPVETSAPPVGTTLPSSIVTVQPTSLPVPSAPRASHGVDGAKRAVPVAPSTNAAPTPAASSAEAPRVPEQALTGPDWAPPDVPK